jgi:hypothetical protein
VDRNVNKIVITEDRGKGEPGYLHVYTPDDNRWRCDRFKVCVEPTCGGVTGDDGYVLWSWRDCQLYVWR